MRKLILLFGLLLAFVPTANADLIQFDISGLVSTSSLSGVSAGDSWTAMFTVDTNSPNLSGDTFLGTYQMNLPFDLKIGPSFTRHYSSLEVGVINNDPEHPFGDAWHFLSPLSTAPDWVSIDLQDTTGTAFNSIDLPPTLNLSAFNNNSMAFIVGSTAQIVGTVTAVTTVPEPSTILLLGAGLAGVGLIRRRFKK